MPQARPVETVDAIASDPIAPQSEVPTALPRTESLQSENRTRRMESIGQAAMLIHSLDECEIELLAELVTRRVDHGKVSSLVRIMSVAVTIPDLIDLLFDALNFEDDGTEKDGYFDTVLGKALAIKIGEEKAAEVLSGETSLRWAKSEPVPAE